MVTMKFIQAIKLDPRSEAISFYSDMHKEAYGYRPRPDWSTLSTEEIDALGQEAAEAARQRWEDEAEDNDPEAWKKYV